MTPLTLPAHASLLTGTFPAFHGVRDNGGFYVADDQTTLAEVLQRPGLPDRRLRRRVRARSPLGDRAGVRHLLRRLRPVEVRTGRRHRRRAAAGQRGRGSRDGVAARAIRQAVLRVGPSLRSARALRGARGVRVALSGDDAGRVRRRGGIHGRAGRPPARCARRRIATAPSSSSPAITASRWASTRSSSTASSSTTRRRRCR